MYKHSVKYLVMLLLCLVLVTSCKTDIDTIQKDDLFFTTWEDSTGYMTNDLSRVQDETPFSVIIPKYLPEDINPSPVITGLFKDFFSINGSVRISYLGSSDGYIDIIEYNSIRKFPINSEATIFSFQDIRIFELESTEMSFSHNGSMIFVPFFHYEWNINNVGFVVQVWNYEHDTAREVIQSMISEHEIGN